MPKSRMEFKHLILGYRAVVLLLAIFYMSYSCINSNWGAAGGPFRFLTIWGLAMSLAMAWQMFRISLGQSSAKWDSFGGATAVVNAMVVFLYWTLYFEDPKSVTPNGQLDVWWREFYMHLFGPILMWIDAFFFNRIFRQLKHGLLLLVTSIVAYLAWIEFLVMRFNDSPVGSVTQGLPYPFLNNLDVSGRIIFYSSNIGVAIIFMFLFAGIAWGVRKIFAD